eukprot:3802362-Amphidinium_carterae.1
MRGMSCRATLPYEAMPTKSGMDVGCGQDLQRSAPEDFSANLSFGAYLHLRPDHEILTCEEATMPGDAN